MRLLVLLKIEESRLFSKQLSFQERLAATFQSVAASLFSPYPLESGIRSFQIADSLSRQ